MAQMQKKQKRMMDAIKNFLLRWHNLIMLTTIYSFILLLVVLINKSDWKVPENWDLTLIISIVLSVIAAIFLITCAYFFVQFFLKLRARNRNNLSSLDEEYLQEYVRGVGTYLGSDSDQELSLYKSVAADIYRHIPQKYWDLVDKIDDDISTYNKDTAWKDLKLFIKLIVRNEEEQQNR